MLFVVLLVASILLGGEPPAVDDPTPEVVAFWTEKESKQLASAIIGAIAIVPFLWFAGVLREALRRAGSDRLGTTALAGAVLVAVGGALSSALQFAAVDSAGDVPAEVTQTLSVLYVDSFFPFAVGFATLFLATAIAVLRHGGLPRWLAFVALLLALIAITPIGFAAFLLGLAWILVASVLLFRGGSGEEERDGGEERDVSPARSAPVEPG